MTTATIRRSPRATRRVAAVFAIAIAVIAAYQVTESRLEGDRTAAQPAAVSAATPAASPRAAYEVDPFQVMADLTPVVSARTGTAAVATDPFAVMSDLSPVVSSHFGVSITSADPFDMMRDFPSSLEITKAQWG